MLKFARGLGRGLTIESYDREKHRLAARLRIIRIDRFGERAGGITERTVLLGLPPETWRYYEDGVEMPSKSPPEAHRTDSGQPALAGHKAEAALRDERPGPTDVDGELRQVAVRPN